LGAEFSPETCQLFLQFVKNVSTILDRSYDFPLLLFLNGHLVKKAFIRLFSGGIMTFWQWLTAICQSTAPAGEPFAPHWSYVALAVVMPVAFGLIVALSLKGIEKIFDVKLGGGDF
jgi:hypothetical protein